jgi:hypothetical protein
MGGVLSVPEAFAWAWGQMVQYNTEYLCEPGQHVHYDRATVSYHSFARNTLVKHMFGEWLLMLDTDMLFEPDIAVRMVCTMERHNIDVLTALYCYKSPPNPPVIYVWGDNDQGLRPIGAWEKTVPIFEVGSAGAGCLLVKRSVYNRIKDELHEEPFDIIHPYSEDNSFFLRLKRLGIKPYCNANIECGHITMKPATLSDYMKEEVALSDAVPTAGFVLKEV